MTLFEIYVISVAVSVLSLIGSIGSIKRKVFHDSEKRHDIDEALKASKRKHVEAIKRKDYDAAKHWGGQIAAFKASLKALDCYSSQLLKCIKQLY